ncbi:MAG: hypothetical protein MJ114_03185 [Acetatifactor sp.]|nr:hypothetical protein [Acetatifactor sp.]
MADKVTNYICPACMGSVHFAAETGMIECDYCGSTYSVEEMEKMMAEANASAEEAAKTVDQWEQAQQEWIGDNMTAYSCPSCRAELICDDSVGATSCPYCGNPTIVPAQFSGIMKPEYVVPFKLTKGDAVKKLQEHCKGKTLLPKSFTENNHLEEVKGVYVPFWLYDGVAKGAANYAATKERTETRGDEKVTITEHYKVSRAGEVAFEKIPADGSSKMPDDLMDSIEPYDYSEMKTFSKAYLAGFMADKYDVSAEDNSPRIQERAKNTFQAMLRDTVKGYDSVNVEHSNTVITEGKVTYALMPVWLLATKWNDKNFLFAMNGQSGKMVGDLPVDMGKYWKIVIGVILALEALMGVISFASHAAMSPAGIIVKFIVIPLIIGFIVGGVMKGKMKSVFTATTANSYMDKNKLRLNRNWDAFSHRTEKVTKIQKQQ